MSVRIVKTLGETPGPTFYHCAVTIDNKLYVIAGKRNEKFKDTIHVYNMETNTWTSVEPKGDLPGIRFKACAVAVDYFIYLYGGVNEDGCAMNTLHKLDVNTMNWEEIECKGSIPAKRSAMSLVHYSNKLYMFGGYDQQGDTDRFYDDLHCFDLETNKWMELSLSGAPSARCCHSACIVDDKMYVFGGLVQKKKDTKAVNDLYCLHFDTLEWELIKTSGSVSPRFSHACMRLSNYIVIACGIDDAITCRNSVFTYNTITKKWKKRKINGTITPCTGITLNLNPFTNEILLFGGRINSLEGTNQLLTLAFGKQSKKQTDILQTEKENYGLSPIQNKIAFKKRKSFMVFSKISKPIHSIKHKRHRSLLSGITPKR